MALAHSNIALAKYWGKRDAELNLPDVPSLSMTLAALSTRTRVQFDPSLEADQIVLNGSVADASTTKKVSAVLDRVRGAAAIASRARVESMNDFPTASGLASSASGFAALALASSAAAGLDWSSARLSGLARASSVSAARSIFGGFAYIEAGAISAAPLDVSPLARDLAMVIAVTDAGPKPVGSTSAMLHTQATSPYYQGFRDRAPAIYEEVRAALLSGDLARLGDAMEHSALAMHAAMLAARPSLIYWNPATLAVIHGVRELRARGTFAHFTIDAGPHVKVLCQTGDAARIRSVLAELPGVQRVIVSGPGAAARLLPSHEFVAPAPSQGSRGAS
ncbi:MAG TPA: diphosphomevalonate decarboxylase [Polyangiaceae bacterium]|nr:diphosphomevalonate decarboxylase [Polyangiaceae bacterium]